MPYRSWMFAVAFGLIAGLGQAQQQTTTGQRQAGDEQSPTETYPLPFPVEIVEDQAAADTRQRGEEEARQREIDDLIAQQGMNEATRSINQATQEMRDYAHAQTILIAVGTVLLFVTLGLTWQANRAAVRSVEIVGKMGESQLRAYVDLGEMTWFSHWVDDNQSDIVWRFSFGLKNTGTTPTKRLEFRARWCIADTPVDVLRILDEVETLPLTIGAIGAAGVLTFDVFPAKLKKVQTGELIIYIIIEATYGNVINPESQHITRIGMESGVVAGDPLKYWNGSSNPVNIKFKHIRHVNCVDDECK